jgi:hypothetical protein
VSFAELLDAARGLPRDEQLQLAQTLLADSPPGPTPAEEAILEKMFPPEVREIEIWSPFDAHGAAEVLQRLLDEAGRK